MKVFTILIESALVHSQNDNLKKRIMLYETSDIYDVRTLGFKVNQEGTSINNSVGEGSYTNKLTLDVMTVTSGKPESMTCQTFANDPSVMSKIEGDDDDKLSIGTYNAQNNTVTLEWDRDGQMSSNFKLEMYLSDPSGFTYKVVLTLSRNGTSNWSLKK